MYKKCGFISTTCLVALISTISAPLPVRANNLEERISQLETKEEARSEKNLEMLRRLDDLQNQLQSLSGQIEVATHDIEMMQQRQQALYSDLDRRIMKLSAAGSNTNAQAANSNLQQNTGQQLNLDVAPKTTELKGTAKPKSAPDNDARINAILNQSPQLKD